MIEFNNKLAFEYIKKLGGNGANSFEELFARTGEFLNEVIKKEQAAGKDILIVGHGAMNNSIISQIRNIPRAKFWETAIPNCKLIEL